IVHVREEHAGGDDVIERRAGSPEDLADVLEDLMGLRLDPAGHEIAGLRIDRDLSREKEHAAGLNGLRIRTDRRGRVRSGDRLAHYAALTTLPDRRQRVQTRSRLMPPLTIARTR